MRNRGTQRATALRVTSPPHTARFGSTLKVGVRGHPSTLRAGLLLLDAHSFRQRPTRQERGAPAMQRGVALQTPPPGCPRPCVGRTAKTNRGVLRRRGRLILPSQGLVQWPAGGAAGLQTAHRPMPFALTVAAPSPCRSSNSSGVLQALPSLLSPTPAASGGSYKRLVLEVRLVLPRTILAPLAMPPVQRDRLPGSPE